MERKPLVKNEMLLEKYFYWCSSSYYHY
jgi:hypothetical protein